MSKDIEINNEEMGSENEEAQYNLGVNYQNGIGVEKDETKAFEYYKKSAEKGHDMAQNNLASLYKNGEGIEKNIEKALYWFNKAAENGNELAQYDLGQYYRLVEKY